MIRIVQIVAIGLSSAFLAVAVAFVLLEGRWVADEPAGPHDYFLHGSTGTELMPLVVFEVLPRLFPDQFQPGGAAAGDWIDQFGFVRGPPRAALPFGVNVSHFRPKSGAPSPIAFVGFNCAVCHTASIRRSEQDPGVIVEGMGNAGLDLVAFGEAIKTSLLDEKRLTVDAIASAEEALHGKSPSLPDRAAIALWLNGARAALRSQLPLRGRPYGGAELRDASLMPSGPGRNEPMKETVRFLIDQTPAPPGGSSKIPVLYHQARRSWAQFDGSVRDPLTRNSLAALGVGASVHNLRKPGILHTMQQSYTFLKALDGPRYAQLFPSGPGAIDAERARQGRDVYARHCASCHGAPSPDGRDWIEGPRQGEVVPASEIETDSARVTFRFYGQLDQIIYDFFPGNHPLKPKRSDVRSTNGFISAPIEAAFTRAPYLHNGSVPTLAELINLKPRRTVFYKGASFFDTAGVGLVVTDRPDARHYFRYDALAYGNSNKGHDYPWAYRGPGWDEAALSSLLEYLKTL